MKLLILTQKIDRNDDVLGFFHSWVKEFAKHFEVVTVICLFKGVYDLPANVKVLSLGKEANPGAFRRVKYLLNFYKFIWQERMNYDAVFVHMNVEYAILGGLFWRLRRQAAYLWYTHRHVNWKLRLGSLFVRKIFTASTESYTLPSSKLEVVGHGIDLLEFFPGPVGTRPERDFKIIYCGRISQIKNQKLLIEAANCLVSELGIKDFSIDLVGAPIYERDEKYLQELKQLVAEYSLTEKVNFIGKRPNHVMPELYRQADLSVNLCPTGGMDKAVLESLACGIPVLVLNRTFVGILGSAADKLLLSSADYRQAAEKIVSLMRESTEQKGQWMNILLQRVKNGYGLPQTISKVSDIILTSRERS